MSTFVLDQILVSMWPESHILSPSSCQMCPKRTLDLGMTFEKTKILCVIKQWIEPVYPHKKPFNKATHRFSLYWMSLEFPQFLICENKRYILRNTYLQLLNIWAKRYHRYDKDPVLASLLDLVPHKSLASPEGL